MSAKLDFRRLRYFVAVCELGSFSRASEFLNVAQSALSQHVASLEQDLGVQLLVRQPRGVSRTEAGDRLHAHARGVLHALEQAELDVVSLARSAVGPVMVGFNYTAMEAIGLPFIRRVAATLTEVKLRVIEAHSEIMHDWMLSGQADIALTLVRPNDDRLEAVPLLDEELVCLGTRAMIGDGGPIDLADVLRLPLIMPGRTAVLQALASDAAVRRAIAEKVHLEIESAIPLKRAVSAGLGVTVQSAALAGDEIASGELVARPVVNPSMGRTLYLVSSRIKTASRAVMEARRLMVDVVREAHAAGRWPGRWRDSHLETR
ncbi:LysR substrate-binding domain-containing protein [Azospirillum sp. HJ39]|uniref:LysR family transcriptional regulator n=1 Tax=Azospirillum sp. HJ39 TaxID=3159496 RepID=UPI003558A3E1